MPELFQTDFLQKIFLQKIFPRAYPEPVGSGCIKQFPEDFIVDEELSFPFTGEGEHAYLKVRKTNQNTMWVIGVLSKYFSVKERDIGYAGLKDRHAVTTQWFSLLAKSATPEKIELFKEEGIEIIDVQRHSGKLRKGAIKYNRFRIVIRELDVDELTIQERMQSIISSGVPNYFDEQRFGRQRQNLVAAQKMFSGELRVRRPKKRIYLSAVRSWLFNLVLAERIDRGCWATGLDGDVFMLDGSKKYFHEEKVDAILDQRLAKHDIHPTGPLWGEGVLETSLSARQLEMNVLDEWNEWCKQLENARMKQQRRACRIIPDELQYSYSENERLFEIAFNLPAGAYATNLIKEIINVNNA